MYIFFIVNDSFCQSFKDSILFLFYYVFFSLLILCYNNNILYIYYLFNLFRDLKNILFSKNQKVFHFLQ